MYNENIEKMTLENTAFRTIAKTGKHSQLVLMSIAVGGEIGEEVHETVDQILFFVSGRGRALVNGEEQPVQKNSVVFVPAGTKHNFINSGDDELKLFTVYSPPEH